MTHSDMRWTAGALVAALVLTGCSGSAVTDEAAGQEATATAATQVVPEQTGDPSASVEGRTEAVEPAATASPGASPATTAMGLPSGPLAPGMYTSAFEPTLSLRIEEDGWQGVADTAQYVGVAYPAPQYDDEFFPLVSFQRLDEVYDLGASSGDPQATAVPDDLIAYLRDSGHLEELSPPEPMTLGGVDGQRFAAEVVSGNATLPGPDGDREVLLLTQVGGEPLYLPVGEQVEFIELDIGEDTVLATVETAPSDREDFMPKAQALLDTVAFER